MCVGGAMAGGSAQRGRKRKTEVVNGPQKPDAEVVKKQKLLPGIGHLKTLDLSPDCTKPLTETTLTYHQQRCRATPILLLRGHDNDIDDNENVDS